MSQTEQKGVSLVERFETMRPEEFRAHVQAKWNATEQIIEPILGAVEEGHYTPLEGAKAVACLTGETFGYGEFHGSLLSMPPAELIAAVRSIGTSPQTR